MSFCDSTQNQGFKLALDLRGSTGGMPFNEDDMFSPWTNTNDFQCVQVIRFLFMLLYNF